MHQTLLRAFVASTILLCGAFGSRAGAMTPAAPSALGVAAAHSVVTPAAVVCGVGGCVPVQTKRLQRPLRRANMWAPLVVPLANAPQTTSAQK
jgi:hypothetical protein